MEEVKGYKVFRPDWICRGFQFAAGQIFEEDIKPSLCNRGFHFCKELKDCFNYYSFNPDNKVAEVIALGEIDKKPDDSKCCTNKIQIVKEITWEEVLRLVNTGKANAGFSNSGDYNSGNWNSGNRNSGNGNSGNGNSGDYNSGNGNSGNRNSGNWNSGNRNSGDYNSGNWNSGNRNSGNGNSGNGNSGDYNSGNWNSGDWNRINFSSGCFNTRSNKIYLFNKLSNWTYMDWVKSEAKLLLDQMPGAIKYICWDDMTAEDKIAHPDAETTGGYIKKLDNTDTVTMWWHSLSDRARAVIMSIPNFDKDIFKEITGIEV